MVPTLLEKLMRYLIIDYHLHNCFYKNSGRLCLLTNRMYQDTLPRSV